MEYLGGSRDSGGMGVGDILCCNDEKNSTKRRSGGGDNLFPARAGNAQWGTKEENWGLG